MLAALAVVGASIFTISVMDLGVSGNFKKGQDALFHAEAGIHHVLSEIQRDVDNGALVLDSAVETVNYTSPLGLNFDPVTQLTRLADGVSYLFRVDGTALDAEASIEVVIRGGPLPIGIFGNRRISMGPGVVIQSYDSSTLTNPTSGDSTHAATVGTNEEMGGGSDGVEGTIYLGEDTAGNPASYTGEGSSTATVVRGDRIDPDPLGAVGGALAAKFASVATVNDNASAVGGTLVGGVLTVEGDMTLVAGNYYVDEIDVGNHETLTIDASAGPVNIYLTGPGFIASQGEVITTPPLPDNLHIFSNSNSDIQFKPKTDFTGTVYAPYADFQAQPNGDLKGSFWANDISLMPGNLTFHDTRSSFGFSAGSMHKIVLWDHIRK
jgi:choice-of-anchor A domain-containing protein